MYRRVADGLPPSQGEDQAVVLEAEAGAPSEGARQLQEPVELGEPPEHVAAEPGEAAAVAGKDVEAWGDIVKRNEDPICEMQLLHCDQSYDLWLTHKQTTYRHVKSIIWQTYLWYALRVMLGQLMDAGRSNRRWSITSTLNGGWSVVGRLALGRTLNHYLERCPMVCRTLAL